MGKNTYAEINNKTNNSTNVLPGRNCFVLSSSLQHVTNATVIRDITEVDLTNMYVIGGKRLFDHFLPHASTVYVTHIDKSFACDTFFDVKALAANFMRVDQHRTGDLTFAMYRNKEFLFG